MRCVLHGSSASASQLLADVLFAVLHSSGAWHREARNEALAGTGTRGVVSRKRLTQLVWTSNAALSSAAQRSRAYVASEGRVGISTGAVAKCCATAVAVTLNTTVSVRMVINVRLYCV